MRVAMLEQPIPTPIPAPIASAHERLDPYPYGYTAMLSNQQGWLWLESVGAWLGITDGAVVCYDRDGQRLENYATLAKAKKQAEARVAELEARLRQLEEERRRQQTKNQESRSND